MGLNIKSEETCRLAAELADLTGETKTGAITVALRERLDREQRQKRAEALARELHEIGQRCSRLLLPGPVRRRAWGLSLRRTGTSEVIHPDGSSAVSRGR